MLGTPSTPQPVLARNSYLFFPCFYPGLLNALRIPVEMGKEILPPLLPAKSFGTDHGHPRQTPPLAEQDHTITGLGPLSILNMVMKSQFSNWSPRSMNGLRVQPPMSITGCAREPSAAAVGNWGAGSRQGPGWAQGGWTS